MAITEFPTGYNDDRKLEAEWRTLSQDEQPYLVVYFGMLGYQILAVCDTEPEAEEVLTVWTVCAVLGNLGGGSKYGNGLRLKGWTRCVSPHDLQIRQQWDLDDLTSAIIGSYPTERYTR